MQNLSAAGSVNAVQKPTKLSGQNPEAIRTGHKFPSATPGAASATPATPQSVLLGFEQQWQRAQAESQRKLKLLAPESRSLVELQTSVNRLGFQSQLFSQAAESVNSTLRRLQQLGGNRPCRAIPTTSALGQGSNVL